MHDKTVRRRRAVLAALVALSLILLTAYFGEAPTGALHSAQRGFLTVVSPIQNGADKALKPVRDLFGWVGDTLHARGQRDQLRREVDVLRKQVVSNEGAARQAAELQRMVGLDTSLDLSRYTPVSARVIERSPTLWYSTVGLDAGSSAGVRIDDPVVNGEGLVGKITAVTSDASIVMLLSDQASGVSAMVNSTGATGIIQPKVGDPSTLVLGYLNSGDKVHVGQNVVTSGTISNRLEDLFPPEIPIGQVTKVSLSDLNPTVEVRPFANLRQLDVVQVLTRNTRGVRLGAAVAQLQGGGGTASSTQTASTQNGAG